MKLKHNVSSQVVLDFIVVNKWIYIDHIIRTGNG